MSGTRRRTFGALGISPSRSEPSTPAKAQNRSPTITTPFGRAIPPRRGGAEGVGASEQVEEGRVVHPNSIDKRRPPGNPPGGLFAKCLGPSSLPAASAEEAEQRQHENHDQDDPEKRHESPFVDCPFRGGHLLNGEVP